MGERAAGGAAAGDVRRPAVLAGRARGGAVRRVVLPRAAPTTSGWTSPARVMTVDVAGESVLVTSDEHGVLHAAYNVCRHRGSQLRPPEQAACDASALRCPYHSWTYGLDGRLLKAPHADVDDPQRVLAAPGRRRDLGRVRVRAPDAGAGANRSPSRSRTRRARWPTTAWPTWSPAHADLRGGGQLQGAAGELQRVLPLRAGAPGALPAGAGVRRRRRRASTGTTASPTARARGRSRRPAPRPGSACPGSTSTSAPATRATSSTRT